MNLSNDQLESLKNLPEGGTVVVEENGLTHTYFRLDKSNQYSIGSCSHVWVQDEFNPPHWLCTKCGYGKHLAHKPE